MRHWVIYWECIVISYTVLSRYQKCSHFLVFQSSQCFFEVIIIAFIDMVMLNILAKISHNLITDPHTKLRRCNCTFWVLHHHTLIYIVHSTRTAWIKAEHTIVMLQYVTFPYSLRLTLQNKILSCVLLLITSVIQVLWIITLFHSYIIVAVQSKFKITLCILSNNSKKQIYFTFPRRFLSSNKHWYTK